MIGTRRWTRFSRICSIARVPRCWDRRRCRPSWLGMPPLSTRGFAQNDFYSPFGFRLVQKSTPAGFCDWRTVVQDCPVRDVEAVLSRTSVVRVVGVDLRCGAPRTAAAVGDKAASRIYWFGSDRRLRGIPSHCESRWVPAKPRSSPELLVGSALGLLRRAASCVLGW